PVPSAAPKVTTAPGSKPLPRMVTSAPQSVDMHDGVADSTATPVAITSMPRKATVAPASLRVRFVDCGVIAAGTRSTAKVGATTTGCSVAPASANDSDVRKPEPLTTNSAPAVTLAGAEVI